jgi:hypothetical protein
MLDLPSRLQLFQSAQLLFRRNFRINSMQLIKRNLLQPQPPFARRVISRTRLLKRAKAFGAIARLISGQSVKLNPRNLRSCGLASALLDSFPLSLSFCVMNCVMLFITR